MTLAIIVAVSEDGAIGHQNQLLWHLSEDLKRFKALTTGHTIIMGRKTFDSLPKGALPNRRNIVISRQQIQLAGAEVYPSLDSALEAVKHEDYVYIIGGGEIYASTLAIVNEMHLTRVHHNYPQADTRFPEWNEADWQVKEIIEFPQDGDRNSLDATYYHYIRK